MKVYKQTPSISIIFPTLNGKDIITNCLDSIKQQSYPREKIEVIVVDNGSTDGTAQLIAKNYPKVKLIKLRSNIGSAPALNIAAKISKGEYVLATNDDVIFDKDCIASLIILAETDPQIGIVTGKMLYAAPPHKLAIPGFRINHYLGYYPYDLKDSNKVRESDWAVGACLLIKRSLLKKLGYFDKGFIFCGEEYDLSFRVKRLGLKIIYTPNAIFYHRFKRSAKPNKDSLFAHYRGKIRYILKNGRLDHIFIFFPSQLILSPIINLLRGKADTILPLYKAFLWNLTNLSKTLKARHQNNLLTSMLSFT